MLHRRNIAGFTLIEVQVSLLIASITLLAAFSMYIFYWRMFVIGNNMLDVYSNSRIAAAFIARDIRSSSQVAAQYPETGTPAYSTSDNILILKTPSIDASWNVITPQYDYIVYRMQSSDLYRIVIPDAMSSRISENRAVAHYCSVLTFSSGGVTLSNIANLSAINTVGMYLPLNKSTIALSGTGSQTASIAPTTVVRLRNK